MKSRHISQNGFTLLELTIAVVITAFTLPVFFQLVFNLTQAQLNIAALQQVKEDGDFIRRTIITNIENSAYTIDSTCSDILDIPAVHMCFFDVNGTKFGYGVIADQIASYSAVTSPVLLNSNSSSRIPTVVKDVAFVKLSEKAVQFNYTVEHNPPVEYLASPQLTYDFFVLIRERN